MDGKEAGSCHAVIAGFGLPGREIARLLGDNGYCLCVIDANPLTAQRCQSVPIVTGDARDEAVLRQAGIERAMLYAITLPDDAAVTEAIAMARRIRPELRIVARVQYTSSGIKAKQLGAQEVVVAEQLVAAELFRRVGLTLSPQGKQEETQSSFK